MRSPKMWALFAVAHVSLWISVIGMILTPSGTVADLVWNVVWFFAVAGVVGFIIHDVKTIIETRKEKP